MVKPSWNGFRSASLGFINENDRLLGWVYPGRTALDIALEHSEFNCSEALMESVVWRDALKALVAVSSDFPQVPSNSLRFVSFGIIIIKENEGFIGPFEAFGNA